MAVSLLLLPLLLLLPWRPLPLLLPVLRPALRLLLPSPPLRQVLLVPL
jgi:hypothetical protein